MLYLIFLSLTAIPFFDRYLFIPNVLSAAVSRGCTMLHPGYGFLAENAGFVDICKEHGINFIGPNVSNLYAQISFGNITLGN